MMTDEEKQAAVNTNLSSYVAMRPDAPKKLQNG
jgi:hypothetical protein